MPDKRLKSTLQWGGGCDEAEYSDLSRPQLLEMLQRYDKALRKITAKAHDEIALHKYREESRTGPNEFEKGRLRCHLPARHDCGVQVIGSKRLGGIAFHHHLHESPCSPDCAVVLSPSGLLIAPISPTTNRPSAVSS